MIKERTPLAMYEVKQLAGKVKETDKMKQVAEFIDNFIKTAPEKAKKLKEEIEQLNVIKLRPIDVVKIVDVMPENAIELNKIFTEISLDTDETNKILDTIKKNK